MTSSPRPPARSSSSIAEACFDLASESLACGGGAGSPAALPQPSSRPSTLSRCPGARPVLCTLMLWTTGCAAQPCLPSDTKVTHRAHRSAPSPPAHALTSWPWRSKHVGGSPTAAPRNRVHKTTHDSDATQLQTPHASPAHCESPLPRAPPRTPPAHHRLAATRNARLLARCI